MTHNDTKKETSLCHLCLLTASSPEAKLTTQPFLSNASLLMLFTCGSRSLLYLGLSRPSTFSSLSLFASTMDWLVICFRYHYFLMRLSFHFDARRQQLSKPGFLHPSVMNVAFSVCRCACLSCVEISIIFRSLFTYFDMLWARTMTFTSHSYRYSYNIMNGSSIIPCFEMRKIENQWFKSCFVKHTKSTMMSAVNACRL